ncbi:MAG: helix-hairpin-helix domain-containing protein [Opitutales bacterium]
MHAAKKKKKVDYEALNSALMRIPRMDVATARNLIDIGIREIFELQGRAPEVLFEEARSKNNQIPEDRIRYFRMAVYFAESEHPEPQLLHPDAWT